MEKTLARKAKAAQNQKNQLATLAIISTLTLWRWRQSWRQMILIGLALLVACTLACVPALVSTLTETVGLQELLYGSSARTTFALNVNTATISSATVNATLQKFARVLQPGLGSYLAPGAPTLAISTSELNIEQPARLNHTDPLNVYATPIQSVQSSLHLLQGYWASERLVDGVAEFMVSESTAHDLALHVGTTLLIQSNFITTHAKLPVDARGAFSARLVGIFADPSDAETLALHGATLQPVTDYVGQHYTMLLSSAAFLQICDGIATSEQSQAVTAGSVSSLFHLSWYYHLQTAQIEFDHLNDLTSRLTNVQYQVTTLPTGQSHAFPYINDAVFANPPVGTIDIFGLLSQYVGRVSLVNLPLSLLAWQTIALLLFFACLLFGQLIERQMAMSAHLSSRGAKPGQIRGSLSAQGIMLCLLALALGPLLASLALFQFARSILPANELTVLNGLFSSPGRVFSLVMPALGITVITALLVLHLLCWRAGEINVLALRGETARARTRPFWQRYYLDLLASVLAFSCFGVALYLAQVARVLDAKTQALVIAPLTLVTPCFLVLGALLLFLRFFPALLSFASHLARSTRGLTALLALVQMERGPRQALRLIMLLTLALTFLSFALVFNASQSQRAQDLATYESGADFAGSLPATLVAQLQNQYSGKPTAQLQQALTQRYAQLPGVLAASTGYIDTGTSTGLDGSSVALKLQAVDASSFAASAIWQPQDSSLPLSALMKTLRQDAPDASNGLSVPAIVDQTTLSNLHLKLGGSFDVTFSSGYLEQNPITFRVVAVVPHIPGVNGSAGTLDGSSEGGLLVDYQTYNAVYLNYLTSVMNLPAPLIQPLMPNYAWLHSSDSPQALTALRAALGSSNLALDGIYDRRAISVDLQNDPLTFSISLLLTLGSITVVLLALASNLVAAWLYARARLSSFVVLRALGTSTEQVIGILLWEQGIIYLVALVLSLLLGGLLAWQVVPQLVFTDLPARGALSELSTDQLYLLQRALPPQTVIPLALQLAWPTIILVCVLTLVLMARVILRASYQQELRLNED